jgi:hypothetical protein
MNIDSNALEIDVLMEAMPERSGPPVREEVLKKSGKELFRELLRIYSTAAVDDYFKDGVWKDTVMRDDYVLLEAHRKEACAISPPDLEDVVVPEPNASFAGIVAPWANGSISIVGPTTEYEFMMKWRLDPARTKLTLGKLTQQRRYYVYLRFKVATFNLDTNMQLSNFINACQMSGSWDKAGALVPPASQIGPGKAIPPATQGAVVAPKSASTILPSQVGISSTAAVRMAEKSPSAAAIATPIALRILSDGAKRPPAPPSDVGLDASKKQRTSSEGASSTMLQPSSALRLAASMSNVAPNAAKATRVARPPILGKRCNPAAKVQTP